MFRTGKLILPLLLACTATPLFAADCTTKKTQAEMTDCFGSNFAAADKALNSYYQRLMKTLQPEDAKLLQEAQRSWISFRDKHCAFVSNPASGGSIYASVFASCATSATVARVVQLRGRLNCQEGDMGCGS
ncbi:lysozyme inhibitor LprI family protein [Sandaracinobacter neustonicus]|nr:lysozyme inhibitor LprI family protein [Sandaracinobacter neustonicus]